MKRYCGWIFLFFWYSIYAQQYHSDDISKLEINLSAECEPLTTAAGCVNLVSGHFFQVEQDLVSNTIEPLNLIRYYDSGSLAESFIGTGHGSQFPLFASDIQNSARHSHAMSSERDGFF